MIAFATLSSGCAKAVAVNMGSGLPDQVYEPAPVYAGQVDSVGTLTEAYIQNTEGLITVNSRLNTLCIAYGKCEKED